MIEHVFEEMNRYEVHKYPYVEVRFPDQLPIHAQVHGWKGDMISAPTKLLDRYSYDNQQVQWVHKDQARRIRHADSIWISMEDDHAWHEEQDKRITYRADPWLVLDQEQHGHNT